MGDLLGRIKLSKYPASVWLGKANGQEVINLIEKLQQRNDELAATVEGLREISYADYFDEDERIADIHGVLDATPQANLNLVKRDVAVQMFLDGCYYGSQYNEKYWTDAANEWAERKYPSGKDGE